MFMYAKKMYRQCALSGRSALYRKRIRMAGCLFLCAVLCVSLCLSPAADSHSQGWTKPIQSDRVEVSPTTALSGLYPTAGEGVSTSAHAHLLMEASTGTVLAQKNAELRLPMASTTKIMTALVAIESMPLDSEITVSSLAVGVEGSSVYLAEGEVLTLSDLLYALLLESANDAASAIAIAVGGDIAGFADMMNRRAASLGLTDTHFVNPHGLDSEEHYTTAYDLAVIARTALENPTFREIVSTQKTTIPLHGNEGVRLLINHNKLLRMYEGCIGVKTGFTKKTGRCLVSAAERDGVTLIAVTLGCPDDWNDHEKLLDYGFSLCESVTLAAPEDYLAPLWVISGEKEYVMVGNDTGLTLTLPRERGEIRCVVELPRFAYAPLKQGQTVGRLVWLIQSDGHTVELGSVPLVARYGVTEVTYKESLWEKIQGLFDH